MVLPHNENAFSNKPKNQNHKPHHHRVTPSEKGNTKQKTNMKTNMKTAEETSPSKEKIHF